MALFISLDFTTKEDAEKLEIIKKAVLVTEQTRTGRKERIRKYLNWVSILINDYGPIKRSGHNICHNILTTFVRCEPMLRPFDNNVVRCCDML